MRWGCCWVPSSYQIQQLQQGTNTASLFIGLHYADIQPAWLVYRTVPLKRLCACQIASKLACMVSLHGDECVTEAAAAAAAACLLLEALSCLC